MITIKTQQLRVDIADDATLTVTLALPGGPKQVAQGKIELFDISNLFDQHNPEALSLDSPPKYQLRSLMQINDGFEMVQDYGAILATFTVHIIAEDIKITARLLSQDGKTDKTLAYVGFWLPQVQFSRNADGILRSWHPTYLQATGSKLMHPSYLTPFGGAFAFDDTFGVGLSTHSHLRKKSLFITDWRANDVIPAQCHLQFMAEIQLEPGDGKNIDCTLRFSENHDWKHLLENYAAVYHAQMPTQRYGADHRPWSAFYAADRSLITPQNPHGFNGAARRLDTPQGARFYAQHYIAPIAGIGQGMLMWVPQGAPVNVGEYPPDFDIFPPAVLSNLPALRAVASNNNLRLGMATRPADLVWMLPPKNEGYVQLDGNNPNQLAALGERFKNVTKLGLGDAFYMDSFGMSPNDVPIFSYLRGVIGQAVPTYSEYSTDLSIPYSGRYAFVGANGNLSWMGNFDFDIYRWLMPDFAVAVAYRAKGAPLSLAQMFERHYTPLLEDEEFLFAARQLKPLVAEYLDGPKWIK